MKISSFLPKSCDLHNGSVPRWIPGATTINDFLHWPDEAPKPKLSFGAIAMVGVDEALMMGLGIASRLHFPTTNYRKRCTDEMHDTLEFFTAKGWIDKPRGYHQSPPALEKVKFKHDTSRGVHYEHMTFESAYVPHTGEAGRSRWLGYTANQTGHCWVLRHSGPQRPWLINIHGYRMGMPYIDLPFFHTQALHENKGLNILHYVLPLHGPRKIGASSGDGVLTPDYLNLIHTEAQAMFELRGIINWLRNDGAPQVGVHGISLGGYTTALLAGLEGDLACAIAGVPAINLVRTTQRLNQGKLLSVMDNTGMSWRDIERMTQVISPIALKPKVPADRRYIYAGILDRLARPEDPIDLWKHWGRPKIQWYAGNHLTFPWEKTVNTFIDNALNDCYTNYSKTSTL